MLEVSDVDLMRLADGTLAEPRLSAVEAEVAAHPVLQEQLEAYLVTGKALADLFSPIAEAPVPERLLATIRPGASEPSKLLHRAVSQRNASAASRLRDWFATVLQPEWRLSPMAAAAALTCVAAIGAAITLTEPQTFVGPASGALADALEKVPTNPDGTPIGWPSSGATFVVDLSFKHKDGRFCRQYYLGLNNDTRAFVGFACSDGNGNWSVEKDAASPVRTAQKPNEIRPSEGHGVAAVEKAVDQIIVGDSLDSTREQALIQQGWPREKQ
jgi:hypothetical protein